MDPCDFNSSESVSITLEFVMTPVSWLMAKNLQQHMVLTKMFKEFQ